MGGERARRVVFGVVSVLMLIGALVPLLVDVVQDGRLTWSLYAAGAVVMAWMILAPWFVLSSMRGAASWAAGVVAVPAYLLLVESLGDVRGWFMGLGLPAAGFGLSGWGGIVWLWSGRRVDRWYRLAGTVLILGLVGLMECILARPHMVQDPHFRLRRVAILSTIGTAVAVVVGRAIVKQLRPYQHEG